MTDKYDEKDIEEVDMYCQECHKKIPRPSEFRSFDALREYMITGLCQDCQDREKLIKLKAKNFFHKGERGY
jgi:uncharacterized protein YlaI